MSLFADSNDICISGNFSHSLQHERTFVYSLILDFKGNTSGIHNFAQLIFYLHYIGISYFMIIHNDAKNKKPIIIKGYTHTLRE